MPKFPVSVYAAIIFLLISAFIWIGFAVLVAVGAHPALPDNRTFQWVMAILAFGCGCTLIVLTLALGKRIRIAYFLITGLLALLAVLTIADDVGLVDLVYLAIVLVPLVLLIKDRAWYLQKDSGAVKRA